MEELPRSHTGQKQSKLQKYLSRGGSTPIGHIQHNATKSSQRSHNGLASSSSHIGTLVVSAPTTSFDHPSSHLVSHAVSNIISSTKERARNAWSLGSYLAAARTRASAPEDLRPSLQQGGVWSQGGRHHVRRRSTLSVAEHKILPKPKNLLITQEQRTRGGTKDREDTQIGTNR